MVINFKEEAHIHKLEISTNSCEHCDARQLLVDFNKKVRKCPRAILGQNWTDKEVLCPSGGKVGSAFGFGSGHPSSIPRLRDKGGPPNRVNFTGKPKTIPKTDHLFS